MTHNSAVQLVGVGNGLSSNGTVPQVVPCPLIRIEFRRVWRKKEESKALLHRFGFDKLLDLARLMSRMPVDDKEDLAIRAMDQSPDKLYKPCCPNAASDDHESKLSLRTHRRHHI